MKTTKIAILGDMHCGHINAIAHPKDQASEDAQGLWKLYKSFCKRHGPFDGVILTGDLIDGRAGRNGGVELLTTDQMNQADMAIRVLDELPVRKGAPWWLASGTPYHAGTDEDFERLVASSFGASRSAVVWAEIGGLVIRARHKINRAMNNLVKQVETHVRRIGSGREPQADYMLFGHLHCHKTHTEMLNGKPITAVCCPTLQGETDFGSRQCDGDVDLGAMCLEIGGVTPVLHRHIVPLGVDTWAKAEAAQMLG